MFNRGQVDWYGRWVDHAESWISQSGRDVLVVRFEDLVSDPTRSLGRAADFLGLAATPDELAAAVSNNDLRQMRGKESGVRNEHFGRADPTGAFVRAGKAG